MVCFPCELYEARTIDKNAGIIYEKITKQIKS